MRKTITVPAAGKKKVISAEGRSVLVENSGIYNDSDEVPIMKLRPGVSYPIFPRSQYPNEITGCGVQSYKKIEIEGTAESAGDQVTLITTDQELELDININFLSTAKSIAGTTSTKAASNNVQQFPELELANADGNLPKRLYIWVVGGATRGINYAFNTDPAQGYLPGDAMYWDNDQRNNSAASERTAIEPLEIVGIDWILAFRFIASVAGETPTLVCTAEY